MNKVKRFIKRLKKKMAPTKLDDVNSSTGLPAFTHATKEDRFQKLAPRPFGKLGLNGKVFVIGFNKTGTTSIGLALQNMGLKIGVQVSGEELLDSWASDNGDQLIKLCKTADAFQDIPFSLPNTYKVLDRSFPNSKFILSIRSNPDQWYQSLIRYHSKLLDLEHTPTVDDLKAATYRSPGWMWRAHVEIFGANCQSPYDKTQCIDAYLHHSESVIEYFSSRPDDLLVVNVSERDTLHRISNFLGTPCSGEEMPRENANPSEA